MSQPPNTWGPPPARRRRRTALFITVTALAATAAFFGGGELGQSLNDDGADPGACKAALEKQYEDGVNGEQTGSGRPPACVGVDAKTLEKYVGEIIADQLGNGIAGATPTP